ncbi:hypothetical protein BC828DRAFT_375128 [Blastocladiella britannica]|nr:hypothetical protein BC828DRAFT_375128 [Blastocladiella britannica]
MPASNTAAYTSPTAHTRFNRVLFGYQVAVVDVAMEVSALAKIAAATAETTMSPFEVPAGPRHFGDRVVVAVSLPHQGCRRLLKHPPPPYGKRRLQESGVAGALAADIGRMVCFLRGGTLVSFFFVFHTYRIIKIGLLAEGAPPDPERPRRTCPLPPH